MKITELYEDGVIVPGVNTTPDVKPGETERQAKKFFGGNGKPKPLGVKGATPNQAFNLGLAENMSVTGTERRRLEKKKGIKIGTPEWFKHWFDLPYLREDITRDELMARLKDQQRGRYIRAMLDAMHKLVQSKGAKHSLGSYAFEIGKVFGFDSRELEKMYRDMYISEVNEAFDNPYPFKLTGPDESQSFVATAQTPNGPLRMDFSSTDFDDFGIDFSVGKSMGKTDSGDEFRVFATVVAMMKKWISTVGIEHVEGFDFGANKDEHASDGRAKLYTRFAKQLASKLGWKLEQSTTGNGDTAFFRLVNPKPIPRDDEYWDTLDEVTIDNKNGRGAVPNNMEVDYFGKKVMMKPSTFIKLASKLGRDPDSEMIDYIKKGGAIGAPFLVINVPWDEDNDSKLKVRGHDGRNRMLAILKAEGDVPVETHLFFNGKYNRARHLEPEFIAAINKELVSQDDQLVKGPLFTEDVTQPQLNALEKAVDKVFGQVGIDVEFTRHFLDRANDTRNGEPISIKELAMLFKKEYQRWGKPIAQMGPNAQAVLKDLESDINVPFVLQWDRENNELDMIAKTVMRKKDFKTSNKEFPVEALTNNVMQRAQQQLSEKSKIDPKLIEKIISKALELGIDPNILLAIAYKESRIRTGLTGDKNKKDFAHGIFQVRKPAMQDVNRYYKTNYSVDDMKNDVGANIDAGARYYKMMYDAYGAEDLESALAGYNGGPKAARTGKNKQANKYASSVNNISKDIQSVITVPQPKKVTPSKNEPYRDDTTDPESWDEPEYPIIAYEPPKTATKQPEIITTVLPPAPTEPSLAPATSPRPKLRPTKTTYQDLAKANNIANPDFIKVGQKINMPDGTTHTVRSGDTLSGIAKKHNKRSLESKVEEVFDTAFENFASGKKKVHEGYKLQLERDADMMVLNIVDTKTGKRTEVRGKPGYESGNYDADDKLHQLLDRIGKSANISELMNGEVVGINPKHPQGASAKTATDKAYSENKVQEAFDNPYPITWEYLKPTGPSSAIAKLDDGSALDIHISEDPAGIYEIEFARGSSKKNMGRSGQGDEFRIFATVQAAMLKWWKQLDKTSVKKITFYANKEDGNRARLYKRFLTMWGDKSEWDIEVNANVKPGLVAYSLTNPDPDEPKNDKKTFMQRLFGEEQTVENFADGKVKGKSRPGRVKRSGASCNGSVTELRTKAKKASGEKAKMYHWCANMKSGRKKSK